MVTSVHTGYNAILIGVGGWGVSAILLSSSFLSWVRATLARQFQESTEALLNKPISTKKEEAHATK